MSNTNPRNPKEPFAKIIVGEDNKKKKALNKTPNKKEFNILSQTVPNKKTQRYNSLDKINEEETKKKKKVIVTTKKDGKSKETKIIMEKPVSEFRPRKNSSDDKAIKRITENKAYKTEGKKGQRERQSRNIEEEQNLKQRYNTVKTKKENKTERKKENNKVKASLKKSNKSHEKVSSTAPISLDDIDDPNSQTFILDDISQARKIWETKYYSPTVKPNNSSLKEDTIITLKTFYADGNGEEDNDRPTPKKTNYKGNKVKSAKKEENKSKKINDKSNRKESPKKEENKGNKIKERTKSNEKVKRKESPKKEENKPLRTHGRKKSEDKNINRPKSIINEDKNINRPKSLKSVDNKTKNNKKVSIKENKKNSLKENNKSEEKTEEKISHKKNNSSEKVKKVNRIIDKIKNSKEKIKKETPPKKVQKKVKRKASKEEEIGKDTIEWPIIYENPIDLIKKEGDNKEGNKTQSKRPESALGNGKDSKVIEKFDPKNPLKYIDKNKIKKYLTTCPKRGKSTMRSFTDYLKKNQTSFSEGEKAWFIYVWISQNIDYNIEGINEGNASVDERENFKTGLAISYGYSKLFKSLGEALGLEVESIQGYSKSTGYYPGKIFEGQKPDHSWNAVKIHGRFYLIDATWGTGKISQKKYIKEFSPIWFCMSSEQFIRTHFPTEQKWQLIKNPISLQQFQNMSYLSHEFYQHGFTKVEPDSCIINTEEGKGQLKIFYNPSYQESNEHLIIKPSLSLSINTTKGEQIKCEDTWYNIQKLKDHFLIDFLINTPGEHNLLTYAGVLLNENPTSLLIMQTKIISEDTIDPPLNYPYISFGRSKINIIEPLYDNLVKGKTYDFQIQSSFFKDLYIFVNNHAYKMENDTEENIFSKSLKIPNNAEFVAIAKNSTENSYEGIVKYKVI
ncbi:MAG: hypothetical protein MJ252_07405 [archaeon]|nr:hypothetical protein [archaeon]